MDNKNPSGDNLTTSITNQSGVHVIARRETSLRRFLTDAGSTKSSAGSSVLRVLHSPFSIAGIPRFFDCVIALNGTLPPDDVFRELEEFPLVAADGGALQLRWRDIQPDVIVGDMDSLEGIDLTHTFPQSEIHADYNQDYNDFQKALEYALFQNWNTVLVLGLHGGELEHTLNNWSILMRYASEMRITLYDNERYGIPITGRFTLQTTRGEIISLIPQPTAVLSTKGLEWELRHERLALGRREGARNRATGEEIIVDVLDGALLLFCQARLPYSPQ